MKSLTVVVLAFLLSPRFADAAGPTLQDVATGSVTMVTCPNISDDYAAVLASLDALKTSIQTSANCSQLGTQVDDFTSVIANRDQFLALIAKAQTTQLTPDEVAEVSTYLTSVTDKASALIDLITASNQCFQDNGNQQLLASIASILSEATSLGSSIAGPWGAPIAIGGQILSGFLAGMERIENSRAGFNFSDPSQWSAYIQNLCTYTSLRPSIQTLLHPDASIDTLQQIAARLDTNLTKINALNGQYQGPLSTVAVRIQRAQIWVQNEIQRIQSEAAAPWNNDIGKYALSKAQQKIENFLLGMEAPKFLQYQLSQSNSGFNDLAQFLLDQGTPLLYQAYRLGLITQAPMIETPIVTEGGFLVDIPTSNEADKYVLLANADWPTLFRNKNVQNEDLRYRLVNAHDLAHDKFDTAAWAYGVAYEYCDYFRASDLYSARIHDICTSRLYGQLTATIDQMTSGASEAPSWKRSQHDGGIRAASWTQALDQWSKQLPLVMAPLGRR